MKKLLLLIFLILSAVIFADSDYKEGVEKGEFEVPDSIIFDSKSLVGKRFIINNSNVPITSDLRQMCILVGDMIEDPSLEAVNNHVEEWEEDGTGGYAKKGTQVEVIEDLRSDISPIVKVKTLDKEESVFYMSILGLNSDSDSSNHNSQIDKDNSSQDESYEPEENYEDDESYEPDENYDSEENYDFDEEYEDEGDYDEEGY